MTTGNVTYVRWRAQDSRRCPRVLPALDPAHPAHAVPCLICDQRLGNGSPLQMLVVEEVTPAIDPARWFSAEAVVVHEACLSVLNDEELYELVDALVPEVEL